MRTALQPAATVANGRSLGSAIAACQWLSQAAQQSSLFQLQLALTGEGAHSLLWACRVDLMLIYLWIVFQHAQRLIE